MNIVQYIRSMAVIVTAFWALNLFRNQQRFKRLQNLSALWKDFANDEKNMHLFNLMNQIESDQIVEEDLAVVNTIIKLKYLALIQQVDLYVEYFESTKLMLNTFFNGIFISSINQIKPLVYCGVILVAQ